MDSKALQDLEVMKACHDVDSTVAEGSLVAIRERYNISEEYAPHALLLGYNELGRTPWDAEGAKWKIGTGSSATVSLPKVRKVPIGITPRVASAPTPKRPIEGLTPHPDGSARTHKRVKMTTVRHKSHCARIAHTPPSKINEGTIRDDRHKDNEGYYALHMTDLPPRDPDSKMQAWWEALKNSARVWDDLQALAEFERGILHPLLRKELYLLLFEVLLARATKQMVWVSATPISAS
ncbi:hypothetical protein BHE74_00004926 [Ensete ventricosum]|nr:hypothetical protein GW17_00015370 [Ensete ventricosum]RWW86304.1 hypothetical protein BHE74_00004926 [Ensete ventricosum]RZR80506.1 hypothetical protein BHM03_00006557 [Ensete ventricosum]